jgi:Kef-type K+ transport system membrane component KefB
MSVRIFYYLLLVGAFGCLTWFIVDKGKDLTVKKDSKYLGFTKTIVKPVRTNDASVWDRWDQNFHQPVSLLLLQISLILVVTRIVGLLAGLIGQPAVVGEIIAGICLGPSLLGWIWPGSNEWLFPAQSLTGLVFLNQIGLAFFMFIVGMELDTSYLKANAKHAVMISHVSIVFPFFLGVWLAYYLYPDFAPVKVSFLSFALFIGIAMSITAFPVLARIVQERKLSGTPIGNLAIICAAADDITAWCILAVVVTIVKANSITVGLFTIGLALLFVASMIYLVKPFLSRRIDKYAVSNNRRGVVVLVFIVVLLSAWIAEMIGIHAIFGAFLAGTIMPKNEAMKQMLIDKVEDISVLLLLPVFFAYTGLRTQINLLGQQQLWVIWFLIMLVAVGGKLGGSAITARLMGQSWSDALSIGILMNTRGLMELVVLNIGYELGVLSPEIFAMMVLMAIATTCMTNPLMNILSKKKVRILNRRLEAEVER